MRTKVRIGADTETTLKQRVNKKETPKWKMLLFWFLFYGAVSFILIGPFVIETGEIGIGGGFLFISFLIALGSTYLESIGKFLHFPTDTDFRKGRMHPFLANSIKNTNLIHSWNYKREISLEKRFKLYLLVNEIIFKIILYVLFFIPLSIAFSWYLLSIIPNFFGYMLLGILYIFSILLCFLKFINFHFYRNKYKVYVLRENPKTYYWRKNIIYFY